MASSAKAVRGVITAQVQVDGVLFTDVCVRGFVEQRKDEDGRTVLIVKGVPEDGALSLLDVVIDGQYEANEYA